MSLKFMSKKFMSKKEFEVRFNRCFELFFLLPKKQKSLPHYKLMNSKLIDSKLKDLKLITLNS